MRERPGLKLRCNYLHLTPSSISGGHLFSGWGSPQTLPSSSPWFPPPTPIRTQVHQTETLSMSPQSKQEHLEVGNQLCASVFLICRRGIMVTVPILQSCWEVKLTDSCPVLGTVNLAHFKHSIKVGGCYHIIRSILGLRLASGHWERPLPSGSLP